MDKQKQLQMVVNLWFFSDGDGTTFRVPNLDKAFLRPDSRGVVGKFKQMKFKSHMHRRADQMMVMHMSNCDI